MGAAGSRDEDGEEHSRRNASQVRIVGVSKRGDFCT